MIQKKENRGGARAGAGRPKSSELDDVIQVRVAGEDKRAFSERIKPASASAALRDFILRYLGKK